MYCGWSYPVIHPIMAATATATAPAVRFVEFADFEPRASFRHNPGANDLLESILDEMKERLVKEPYLRNAKCRLGYETEARRIYIDCIVTTRYGALPDILTTTVDEHLGFNHPPLCFETLNAMSYEERLAYIDKHKQPRGEIHVTMTWFD